MFIIKNTIPTNNMIQIIFHIRFKIFNHFSRALSLILKIMICNIIMNISAAVAIHIHNVMVHIFAHSMLYHQKIQIAIHIKNINRVTKYPTAHRKLVFTFFILF